MKTLLDSQTLKTMHLLMFLSIALFSNALSYTVSFTGKGGPVESVLVQNARTGITKTLNAQEVLYLTDLDGYIGDRIIFKAYSGNMSTIVSDLITANKTINFDFYPCTDANGNHYSTVTIGNQVWMAENLKATKYADGEDIILIESQAIYNSYPVELQRTYPYCRYFQDNPATKDIGGLAYKYQTIQHKDIAPSGWRVPNHFEFRTLRDNISLDEAEQINSIRKTDGGYWSIAGANNASGFSAIATGGFWGEWAINAGQWGIWLANDLFNADPNNCWFFYVGKHADNSNPTIVCQELASDPFEMVGAIRCLYNSVVSKSDGDWNTASTWAGGVIPTSSESVFVGHNLAIGDLTIDASKSITVSAGKQLTVSNSFVNNGTLNLLSDASGTATILAPSTISGSGTSNVNQHLTYRSWYLSSPVSSATSSGMSVIKSYNETNNSWSNHAPTLLAKTGYMVTPVDDEDESILFSGSINTGNQNIALTSRAGTANKAGFNLIGNPYPAFLDWKLVCDNTANASIMRSKTMWYRTKSGVYSFQTVNGASGEGTPVNASRYIPPMQAFWVRANAGGGTLSLTNAMRANAPGTNHLIKAPAAKSSENSKLRLQISNGVNQDETLLYFNSNALNELDTYDSPKMSNDQVAIPEIYTVVGSEVLAINGMQNYTYNQEIPLGFVTAETNSFSLRAIEVSSFDSDVRIILRDNQNLFQPETDITNGIAYNFNSDIANTNDRFSIVFRSATATTRFCNANEHKDVLVYQNSNNQICINLISELNKVDHVAVYNAMGQKVAETKVQRTKTKINYSLEAGVYFVKISIDNKYTTRKVIVK